MKKILALIMFLALSLSVFVACETTSPAEKTAKEAAQIELESAADYLYQLYKDNTVTAVSYDLHEQVAIEGIVYPITWSIEVAEENAEKVSVDATGAKPRVILDTFTDSAVEYVLVATFSLEIQVKDKTITVSYEKKFPRTLPAFQYASFDDYVAAANNTNLFVKGYVTGIISKSVNATNNCIYVDDMSGNGGYYVYGLAEDPAGIVSIGDVVMVNGDKDLYNGTHELKNATVTVLEEPAVDVVAKDFTSVYASATALDDAALVGPQAQLVKICGVTITTQGDNGYYHFKLGELESYLRISSSTNALTKDETDAFKALHTASYGCLADVEGVISIYSGKFYLAPVSANAISNVREPERSDAEKVAFEIEALNLGIGEEIAKNTTVALPAAGTKYDTVAITWTLDGAAVSGSVAFNLGSEVVSHVLVGTFTAGEATQTVTIEFTVAVKSEDLPAGVAFAMGMNQVKAGKVVYATGAVSGRYLATTENIAEAAAVYAEAVEGGYKFYILDGETKLYLDVYANDEGKDSVKFAADGDNVFAYAANVNAWVTTHNGTEKYIGSYNTFTTFSVSNLSYITAENTGVSQFPSFFEVNETIAYNVALNQVKAGKVVYATGAVSGRYLATSESAAEGAKVYFEKAEGGFKFYMLDGETKLYLDVYANGEGKDSVKFDAAGDNVFAYKADVNAWVTTHNGVEKYVGSYNTYTTLSVSNLSYITAENTGVSQFPIYFVVAAAEEAPAVCEHAETTETTVPSTCIAKGSKTVTCNACGETVSSEELPLADHTMADATCLLPSTCSVEGCGHTEGEALGHNYDAEGVCANGCGIAQEHVHSWSDATCTAPKSCACGATEGEALGHTMADATCEAPSTCSVCGHEEGAALGHKYGAWTPAENDTHVSVCANCSETLTKETSELLVELFSLGEGTAYDVKVTLTGRITAVNEAYSSQYGNINVTITVSNHTDYAILCYRMKGDGADKIAVNDIITVTGIVKNYYNTIEFDTGCTLDSYTKHEHNFVNNQCECGASNAADETTATVTISTYATAHSWSNSVKYTTLTMDDNITVKVTKTGSNSGKYYTSGQQWRFYQTESGTLEISAAAGYEIKTVKVTYATKNSGYFTVNGTKYTSATVLQVNGSSVSFVSGGTGTNGQSNITAIEVVYAKV